jgi:hypothetical protein
MHTTARFMTLVARLRRASVVSPLTSKNASDSTNDSSLSDADHDLGRLF